MDQSNGHQQARLAGGYRLDTDGWIYLHLEGKPYDRGYQHGYYAAREIDEALDTARYLARWDTGEDFGVFVEAAEKLFPAKLDDEYRDELHGIAAGARAAGARATYADILAWNGYQELLGNWWPQQLAGGPPRLWKGRRGHHCSALVATGSWTHDGRIVMAHNTWDRYAAGDHYNVILDIVPESGQRMILQAAPGYLSSTMDWWLTGAGLLITETTIAGTSAYDAGKTPEFVLSRKAAQYARDIDEWVEIFRTDNTSGYANSWLLGDLNTGEIARFEMVLKLSGLERSRDGYFSGFNTPVDLKIRNQACPGESEEYSDIRKNGSRRLRWMQLMQQHRGRLDADLARSLIADHYDVYLERDGNPSSRTICGHLELDNAQYGSHDDQGPYMPWGANDGKATDSDLAKHLSFWAIWGHSCSLPFDARAFLERHPQYDWLSGRMKDRPAGEWQQLTAGQRASAVPAGAGVSTS